MGSGWVALGGEEQRKNVGCGPGKGAGTMGTQSWGW